MVTIRNENNRCWDYEMCVQLISEYRRRPLLWDPKHIDFYKRIKKIDAWEAIGQAVGIPTDECKHKMSVLMSSFRREKAKILKGARSGRFKTSKWFAYKHMEFLMDKWEDKEQQSTFTDDSDDARDMEDNFRHCINVPDEKSQNSNDNNDIETLIVTDDLEEAGIKIENETESETEHDNAVPAELKTCSRKRNRSSSTVHSSLLEEEVRESNQRTLKRHADKIRGIKQSLNVQNQLDEEIDAFTKFIQTKMKKYSYTTVNAVQRDISEIIFKADQKYYEQKAVKESFFA